MRTARVEGAFVLEVINDGVRAGRAHQPGMGLRLAAAWRRFRTAASSSSTPRGRGQLAGATGGAARYAGGPRTLQSITRSAQRLRVLVVDDHDVVHWGFRLMLTQQPWVERCLAASNGDDAVELARRYRPHVAVVDLFIGEESGAQVCERLREAEPGTRVLLFSGAGEISASAARAAGASGFAYKDWPAAKIAGAVRLVGLGGIGLRAPGPHQRARALRA